MDGQDYFHKCLNHSETTKRNKYFPIVKPCSTQRYRKISKAFIEISDFKKSLKTLRKDTKQKPKNCSSVFDHFVGLAVKGLTANQKNESNSTNY